MELFMMALPFIKVLAAFALMLLGMRRRIGLGLSILLGGLFMGVIFGLDAASLAAVAGRAVRQQSFLLLAAIVGLIMMLSDGLERSGQSRRLMVALSGYLTSRRLRLIFFPALIGLLPMPGGAIFSAPMVRTVGDELELRRDDQAVVNYWFRHVWELAWPLYPGIILTVALAGIPITALISRTWPAVVAMFAIGFLFYLRKDPGGGGAAVASPLPERRMAPVVREGLPLLIAIVGAICLETALSTLAAGIPFEWGVIGALVAAMIAVMAQNRLGYAFIRQIAGKKSMWSMLFVVVAIFIFKDIMQAAGIVDQMAALAGGGVALFAAAVFLPFLVGMVAGINVAFVGATFPLLLGLLAKLGLQDDMVPYLVLASFSGFTGVMISPIHICFVLTCNYFGADLAATWRRLVLPCLSFALCGALMFLLLLQL